MQARDTLSTDFKSMVSQVESNAGMQVGTDMPPLTECGACQIPMYLCWSVSTATQQPLVPSKGALLPASVYVLSL